MFEATQDPKPTKCKVNYGFVVLFDLQKGNEFPFSWYPRSMFSKTEIPDRWLDSVLDMTSRMTKISFERMPNNSLSLFGKIEAGLIFKKYNFFFLPQITLFLCRYNGGTAR